MTEKTCAFPDCGEAYFASGLCSKHFWRHYAVAEIEALYTVLPGKGAACMFPGCGRGVISHHLCQSHYMQQWRTGELWVLGIRQQHQKCCFEPCPYRATRDGLCDGHYSQKRKDKPLTPLLPPIRPSTKDLVYHGPDDYI